MPGRLALLEAKLEAKLESMQIAHTAELRELRAKLEDKTKRENTSAPRDDELGELRQLPSRIRGGQYDSWIHAREQA